MDDAAGEQPAMSFVELASRASSSDSAAEWVDALYAMFCEARTSEPMLLEALARTHAVLRAAPLDELRAAKMGRLLRAIQTPFRELEACLLAALASKCPAGVLTLAHVLLAQRTTAESQRFLPADLPADLPLEFDACFGPCGPGQLADYFDRTGSLLFEAGRLRQAAVYVKCALACCGPGPAQAQAQAQAQGPALALKVLAYELCAFHRSTSVLPSYLAAAMELEPLPPRAAALAAAFNQPDLAAPDVGALVDDFCRHSQLPLAQHLRDAYQIAWLKALHTVMPRVPLALAAQSGPRPPLELLDRGYPASFDGAVFILLPADKWASLESCLKLVRRLAGVKKLVMPELDDSVF